MPNKKITRGISKDFADAFKASELYTLYEEHKNELLIGIRNNYLNLYYNCDSIAKITYPRGTIRCEIDKYYLTGKSYKSGDKEKRFKVEPSQICGDYEKKIKINSDKKGKMEKQAQSKLVLSNNANNTSNWFCIDIEYVKAFHNEEEKKEAGFQARFDIIAVSKKAPHRIALIELKYGRNAIGGKSGIYKHVEDFVKFRDKDFFEEHLKSEIIKIIHSQKNLNIPIPFELPKEENFFQPEFYFITLNNNAEGRTCTPKQTMAGYLFENKRWDCKRLSGAYCVEKDFGDITKKDNKFNATFLFSKATIKNMTIDDIIDGDYDERIVPE